MSTIDGFGSCQSLLISAVLFLHEPVPLDLTENNIKILSLRQHFLLESAQYVDISPSSTTNGQIGWLIVTI